eukprot:5477358-Pyramimonas_sp.AAC.1
MQHYVVCTRLQEIARIWLGAIVDCADTIPISSLLLLTVHPSVEAVLCCASFCEAFLHTHSQKRVGCDADPARLFEARIRLHCRRHRALQAAWTKVTAARLAVGQSAG